MSNRAKSAQKRVIADKVEELTIWYLSESQGRPPTHLAEDRKSYNGLILRWLEPKLSHVDNVILIEESLGDSWTLRFEREPREIRVFT